jgi:hypothetical protein
MGILHHYHLHDNDYSSLQGRPWLCIVVCPEIVVCKQNGDLSEVVPRAREVPVQSHTVLHLKPRFWPFRKLIFITCGLVPQTVTIAASNTPYVYTCDQALNQFATQCSEIMQVCMPIV